MMREPKPVKKITALAVAAIMTNSVSFAGAFSLYTEGSGAAIGNFAAGIAAEAADASTAWYNPAGLVFLGKEQSVLSGVGVLPSTKITGRSLFETNGLSSYAQNFTGLQGAENAVVPAVHYARPLGPRAAFGLSIVAPFGLSTQYSNSSPVRYAATLSDLKTIDLSPDIAGKLTENFSVGAGVDLQWSQVKFNRVLGAPTLMVAGGNPAMLVDSTSDNEGHSFGVGFHAGVLGQFNDNHTRIGLNYQSKIRHTFHGYSQLTGRLADPDLENSVVFRSDSLFSNNIQFPDILTLSGYQAINTQWAVLGSAVFTGWDVFKTIQLNNVAAFSQDLGQVIVNSTSEQFYRNAWRFALGVNYHASETLMMRAGLGYDQTPTINAERDVRLPDANRWALSIGGHYQMWPSLGFDVGYTYLFARKDTTINKTDPLGTTSVYTVNARAKPYANLVGLQAVWTIDHALQKTK